MVNIDYITVGIVLGILIIAVCWALNHKMSTDKAIILFLMGPIILAGLVSISHSLNLYILDIGGENRLIQAVGGIATLLVSYITIKKQMEE